MSKEKQIEEIPKIKLLDYKMSDKGINEMRYLADEMQKAISNEYRQCIIADERKLEEVLKANGWRKASDVAREIFEEIETLMNGVYCSVQYGCYSYGTTKQTDSPSAQRQCGKLEGVKYLGDRIAELKKKYTEE